MISDLVFGAIMGGGGVGVWTWCRRFRTHRHSWTPWTYFWDEDTNTRTTVQERSCSKCGFNEKHNEAECPPHEWNKWEQITITIVDPHGDKSKNYQTSGLKRSCERCGLKERQRDF